jgi:heme/copper-type cytochrome/quinol oxidase subunit 2
MTRLPVVALTLVLLAFIAGCGGSNTNAPGSSSSQQTSAPGLTIDITISNGSVNPTNAELKAKAGQPIKLRVNSDAPDELHVHSVPDHTFPVEAKPNQTFEFTVDVPGQVEVELHKLDRTVATIQVQQ